MKIGKRRNLAHVSQLAPRRPPLSTTAGTKSKFGEVLGWVVRDSSSRSNRSLATIVDGQVF
jgi:hypothetical protein